MERNSLEKILGRSFLAFLTTNIHFRAQIQDFKFATQKKERNSYSNAILERLFLSFFANLTFRLIEVLLKLI